MPKTYLLLDNNIDNFKKNSKLIFFDEYSKNLIEKKKIKSYQTKFLLTFKDLTNFNYNSNLLNKKIKNYVSLLKKQFNQIHKKNHDEKYWSLILDRILYLIINGILFELNILKKIKKNRDRIVIKNIKFNDYFIDTADFISNYENNLIQPYIRFCVAKNLGFKQEQLPSSTKAKKNQSFKKNFLSSIFNFHNYISIFFRLYSSIFKPFLVIDGYIPKKSCLKIFFKSFGKILIIPSSFFFTERSYSDKKNLYIRKTLRVKEKDVIDKIFNDIFPHFLPSSYLENFKVYDSYSNSFKLLPKVGTAVSLIYNDYFKYMAAAILKMKGKVFVFQHGGLIGKEKYDRDEAFNQKYSSKVYSWDGNTNFRENYFEKFKKIQKTSFIKKDGVLILPTRTKVKYNYNQSIYKKNHPYLNDNYKFYENLNKKIKKRTSIKLFPNYYSNITKQIWIKKFGLRLNFLENKKDITLFNKFKIIVIDDISTPLCELMYVGVPFVIINDELEWLKKSTNKKILKLKKLNILFDEPRKASSFINKNYNKIDSWWEKNKANKIYKDLEKEIIPTNKKKTNLKNLLN